MNSTTLYAVSTAMPHAAAFNRIGNPLHVNTSSFPALPVLSPAAMVTWLQHNTTKSTPHYMDEISPLQFLTIIVCLMVLVIGILGNLLVLIVFGSRFSKIKACELFLTNLALADLLGSIVLPGDKLFLMTGGDYRGIGDAGCKAIHFITITSISVSAITLIAISFDRYVIVRWPLKRRMSMKFLVFICVMIWFLGSLLGIPYLINDNIRLHMTDNATQQMHCYSFIEKQERIAHTLITFFVQVSIPLIVMSATYSLIIYELKKITKTQVFQNHERVTRSRFKRNRKTVKLLFVVVFSFFVCIAPVNTFYLLYTFNAHNLDLKTTQHVFSILLMLQMANSCCNPIIYSKLHTSFRKTTLSLFCSCCVSNISTFKSTLSQFASTRISRFSRTSNYALTKQFGKNSSPTGGRSPSAVPLNLNRMNYLTPDGTPRSILRSEAICMSEIKEKDYLL